MAVILHIHARYREQGGEDTIVDAERELLAAHGHEIVPLDAVNRRDGPGAAAQLAAYAWNPAVARRVERSVSERPPDVAHVHNTWFSLSPSVVTTLRRLSVPTVMTLHNYRLTCSNALLLRDGVPCELCVRSHPWHGARYRCYRGSLPASAIAAFNIQLHRKRGTWSDNVDRFLALTEFGRSRFLAAGLPADRVVVVPNFVPDPGPRGAPPSASRRVVIVGRLSREKGIQVAVEAWRRAELRDLELVIAGDGPLRAELAAQAGGSVRWLGRVPHRDVLRLLLESRALLFPSLWYEGQPLGVLEALAAGVPVLGSRLGGLGDTIAPLGEDWAVPPGEPDEWLRAIRRLTDDDHVNAGGARARTAYEQLHSPSIALPRLERVYSSAGHRDRVSA